MCVKYVLDLFNKFIKLLYIFVFLQFVQLYDFPRIVILT
jgi:hypothetical protein